MKYFYILLLLCVVMPAYAQQLAFPTAEGWGRFATGGRGGYVCHVDDLGDASNGTQIAGTLHHHGTLRYCLTRTGARTIVFRIGGTISMASIAQTAVTNGNLTIAGQSAPLDGNGVLVRDTWLDFRASNLIIRYFRSRRGTLNAGSSSKSISFGQPTLPTISNIIVDHGSYSWATDDVVGFSKTDLSTFQWSISGEGIQSPYSRPMHIGSGGNDRISVLHSFLVHAGDRAPEMQGGRIQVVNTVGYNIKGHANYITERLLHVWFDANYYATGPWGDAQGCCIGAQLAMLGPSWTSLSPTQTFIDSNVWSTDNYHNLKRPNNTFSQTSWVYNSDPALDTPIGTIPPGSFEFPTITSRVTALEAKDLIIAKVGTNIPSRDAVDTRQINDLINYTDSTTFGISNPSEVGGYPTYNAGTAYTDTDWDGIPDSWETLCSSSLGGLNPNNSNDGDDIISSVNSAVNGYSKLEVYLNERSGDYPLNSCGGLLLEDTTPPSTPIMNAPSIISATQIDLSWSASTDDESGIAEYEIEYCVDDGSQICTPSISIPTLGDVVNYSHQNLTSDTTYGYRVRAINGSSIVGSYSSPIVYATTDDAPGPDITTGLVSHWSLNSVLTDAGSAAATLSAQGSPGYVTGRISNAIDLSGSGQYLTTADNAGHDFGTSTDFSFALWFQPDSTGKQYLLSKGQSEGGSSDGIWFIEYGSIPGNFLAGVSSDTWNNYCAVKAPLNVSDGAWHHVGVNILRNTSCTISDIEIYIDGVLATNRSVQFSGTNTNANISNDDPLWVGAENVSGSPASLFNGRIDDVRVYNRILALEDVQALVDLGDLDIQPPTDPSNLVGIPDFNGSMNRVNLSWDISTDDIGPIIYRIQRCNGNGCSNFTDLDTSIDNTYTDMPLQEYQYYRYRIRAEDAVPNISNYTSPVQILTLSSVIPPLSPSALTTSYSGSVAFPSVPTNIATAANSTVSGSSGPTNLATTASSTVTLPSPPTGVETP